MVIQGVCIQYSECAYDCKVAFTIVWSEKRMLKESTEEQVNPSLKFRHEIQNKAETFQTKPTRYDLEK